MSEYLLQLIGKWFSLLVVSTASFLQTNLYDEIVVDVKNNNISKSSEIVVEVVETENTETNDLLSDEQKDNKDEDKKEETNKVVVTEVPKKTVETVETPTIIEGKPVETTTVVDADYVGKLTAYGADCYLCSGEGYLACNTKNGGRHSLKYDGIYYNDDEYGSVRILAAATAKFPCGTIIEVNNGLESFISVVLDTGGDMITAWKNSGTVWMDLAFATQEDARNNMTTQTGVKYNVKRWGW